VCVLSGWKEQLAMETHTGDLGGRVMDRVRQMLCGLHGHDTLLQFQEDRIFLRCVSCGHETPGWDVSELTRGAARRRVQPQVESTRALPAQLISARRVA
jgi:Zn ribbon nucleic-acid-binding protein